MFRVFPWVVAGALLATLACRGRETEATTPVRGEPTSPPRATGVPRTAARPAVEHAASGTNWVDPEPADAQARAEAVAGAAWNQDKTTHLAAPASSRLSMSITTLVDRTTGIGGFASRITGTGESLEQRLARLGAEVSPTQVVIRLPGAVLFDFDSASIRPDAERTLADVAAVLAAEQNRPARIEGHTDSIGNDAYNLGLSQRRAESVKAWLSSHGVPAARLTARGFGASRPVADNATAEGRQKNRRVEIVVGKNGP